ncbi:MAG: hypothetical protein ACE5FJ_00675 [Gemmatimonadales bacterium]
MGRRGIKEYKAGEALELILADRDREVLRCPSCGSKSFNRSPKKRLTETPGDSYRQVRITCKECNRSAVYVPHRLTQPSEPQYT